jgi:hypothetical protein
MARQKLFPTFPIVVVYKSGKKVKIKVINNKNIDEVLNEDIVIPGIKNNSDILEIGLGESYVRRFNQKYKIDLVSKK